MHFFFAFEIKKMTQFQNEPSTINIVEAPRLAESIKATYIRKVSTDEYRNFVDRFETYLKRKKIESMKVTEFTNPWHTKYSKKIKRGELQNTKNNPTACPIFCFFRLNLIKCNFCSLKNRKIIQFCDSLRTSAQKRAKNLLNKKLHSQI